jgi:hypothetical protein
MGTIAYDSQRKTWGPAPVAPPKNTIDVDATNIGFAAIDVRRAGVNCQAKVTIKSDGPIKLVLPGCNRTVSGG